MGWYSKYLFPRICDLLLSSAEVSRYRRELLADVDGDVLEIGFGTGLNLPHYPAAVRKLTIVDPNAGMHALAQKRLARTSIELDRRIVDAERLPFDDGAFDCVVSTFTLCSIDDVERAMSESFRVLKPGGRFLFFEHGLSPEPGVQRWQKRLNWLEMRLADGCRLNRDIQSLVTAQPFSSVQLEQFYMPRTPKLLGHISRGCATK